MKPPPAVLVATAVFTLAQEEWRALRQARDESPIRYDPCGDHAREEKAAIDAAASRMAEAFHAAVDASTTRRPDA